MNDKYTLEKINKESENPSGFLKNCSVEYHKKVKAAAEKIFFDKSKKIVMLAGPSSSGKTTTSKILSEYINGFGGKAYTVSLDDFYHPHSVGYPLDENGKPDYECVEALEIELLHAKLRELSDGKKTTLPVFNFKTGERMNGAKIIELKENDVIIFEGLHALNPVITDNLDAKELFRIYVSVSSRVYNENGNIILSKRDLRFIRRMVRDFSFRSTSVEFTFGVWQSVARGEDKYLFPYEDLADTKLDSFHPCEPCVFSQRATELLSHVENDEYKEKANRLEYALSLFNKTDYSLLPENSLLREFTG